MRVDEIWFVETIPYGTDLGGKYIRFELFRGGMGTDRLFVTPRATGTDTFKSSLRDRTLSAGSIKKKRRPLIR